MKKLLLVFILVFSTSLFSKDYTKHKDTQAFINDLVKNHGFTRSYLNYLFKNVNYQKKVLAIYVPSLRPKPKTTKPKKLDPNRKRLGSWDIYERMFLNKKKVSNGVDYLHKHKDKFHKAYKKYNVEPEYIAAIIGVESDYGKYRGKYNVFDALSTLAFEKNRRQKFYKRELKEFLILSKREGFNPRNVKGSYAGAIGLGQFMPSNYNQYVVDFNKDGKKQMNNHTDAIASIANYFKQHKWRKGLPVAVRARYKGNRYKGHKTGYKYKYSRSSLLDSAPINKFNYNGKVHLIKLSRGYYDELWYGTSNFYTITRYNHQDYYAMAVHQLAQKIKKEYIKKYGKIIR